MNRIILIGNGFDLAHKLETSYINFIYDFWEKIRKDIIRNNMKGKLNSNTYTYENDVIILHYSCDITKLSNSDKGYKWFRNVGEKDANGKEVYFKVFYKNTFLETISKHSIENWVDVEEDYYSELNKCLNDKREGGVEKLNKEFAEVKKYLEEYLKGQALKKIVCNSKILTNIYSISPDDKNKNVLNKHQDNNFLFLNFNYTNTEISYIQKNLYNQCDPINTKTETIHIHGELENTENPIIFGYGDEINSRYKHIENKNDNKYLENIKSIKYSETSNYKRLLTFIDSEEYEIFIMGHSCGISDRTLLNTLFEHKNCRLIRVFYHKESDGTDNFSDIVRNISRNFTNKLRMREILDYKKDKCQLP